MLLMTFWQMPMGPPDRSMAQDLLTAGIGVISCSVAATSLAVYAFRKTNRDRTLLWFGIFGAIYGLRILLGVDVVRAGFHIPLRAAGIATMLITYSIQIPGMMFALTLIEALGTRLAKVMFGVAGLLAVAGCISLLLRIGLETMPQINNFLVVFFFLPTYVWSYTRSSRTVDMRFIRVAFFLFLASVVYDNLSGFQLVRPLGLEPFGFLVLLAAMGVVTAEKSLASEQRLLAVERELEIARRIQLSILPEKVPETQGLEVAVRYVPMTQVAGDFYDFIELPDGRLGVLVADVSGHGVPAALIASMLKMAFVSHAAAAENPAEMLSKLNGALCGRFSSHFVTAVYAVLDAKGGTMTFSGAAHPPMLVKRANGTVDELSENGLMLGAFDFAQYVNASTPLGTDDQVLLYTDGLAEASNAMDEEFGIARLKESFDGGAAGSIQQLFAKTAAWTSNVAQQDDLTAVVVVMR